jgi:hypothetical protein
MPTAEDAPRGGSIAGLETPDSYIVELVPPLSDEERERFPMIRDILPFDHIIGEHREWMRFYRSSFGWNQGNRAKHFQEGFLAKNR